MQESKSTPVQFAICINNSDYPASLERYKVYRILPDVDASRNGDIRVIDESGEDYLYPASYFRSIELPKEVQNLLLQSA